MGAGVHGFRWIIAGCVTVGLLFAVTGCSGIPDEKKRRFNAIAASVGMRDGRVVYDKFSGGGFEDSPELTTVVEYPGSAEQVLAQRTAEMEAAGYRPTGPRDCLGAGCSFEQVGGTGYLHMRVFRAGQRVPQTNKPSPAGTTSVLIGASG